MRQLANKERQSGRTTLLIEYMINEMNLHNEKVYIVAGKFCIANTIKNLVRKMNGDHTRVVPLGLDSLDTYFRGRSIDPRNLYFEHTAYEMASARQLQQIYDVEDQKDAYTWLSKVS